MTRSTAASAIEPQVQALDESDEQDASYQRRVILVHRIVQAGLLITLTWKWSFFIGALTVYHHIPIDDAFFPSWLRSNAVFTAAFLTAVITTSWNLITSSGFIRRSCSWLTLGSISVLCIHQATYNDMTFATGWWTSVWAVWFVHHMDDPNPTALLQRAAFLSRLIISMILLGGAVGKWTSEYWSGEVFYDIYFRDRDYWLFHLLRQIVQPETLPVLAKWYTRQVIVIETLAGFGLWLLPPRWAAGIGVFVFVSIAVSSNPLLLSVVASMIGLAAVGFFAQPEPMKPSQQTAHSRAA